MVLCRCAGRRRRHIVVSSAPQCSKRFPSALAERVGLGCKRLKRCLHCSLRCTLVIAGQCADVNVNVFNTLVLPILRRGNVRPRRHVRLLCKAILPQAGHFRFVLAELPADISSMFLIRLSVGRPAKEAKKKQ